MSSGTCLPFLPLRSEITDATVARTAGRGSATERATLSGAN